MSEYVIAHQVTRFFELLGNDTQLPGAFLFIGMICFSVPMGVCIVHYTYIYIRMYTYIYVYHTCVT